VDARGTFCSDGIRFAQSQAWRGFPGNALEIPGGVSLGGGTRAQDFPGFSFQIKIYYI